MKMSHRYFNRSVVPGMAALALMGVIGSAAAQTSTVIIAPAAPPPPQEETVPPPPGTTVTWQAGHWFWTGSAWSWVEGQYVERPQTTAVWEPGHWAQQPAGGYV